MARVLVVDDDPDILSLVQLQLRHAGHTTMGARSGRLALEEIERDGPPDVAIIDVRMPGMSGFDLAAELRARGLRELPVIFLTARARTEDMDSDGVYVAKPYALSDLLSEVDSALRAIV
jgi:two-component system, OmpR family, response regulator